MGTNLIGGQPVSLSNLRLLSGICKQNHIPLIIDASLLQDNLYFMKKRDPLCKNMSIRSIAYEIAKLCDIMYFSARKLGFVRGGGICIKNKDDYEELRKYVPLYEGFITYGGMSVKEMEALVIGLDETMDENIICQGPEFIEYGVKLLQEYNIPVITPPGGLGIHIDASRFLSGIPLSNYPSASLASALYLCSGIRSMERGMISEDRNEDGSENQVRYELLRLAFPRRVYSISHVNYLIDRLIWLYDNREIIHGLKFTYESDKMRLYFGELEPIDNWQLKLIEQYKKVFSDE